jgi:hypothetical protein
MGFLEIGLTNYFPGWIGTAIFLISASQVARITGLSHWHPAPRCSPINTYFDFSLCSWALHPLLMNDPAPSAFHSKALKAQIWLILPLFEDSFPLSSLTNFIARASAGPLGSVSQPWLDVRPSLHKTTYHYFLEHEILIDPFPWNLWDILITDTFNMLGKEEPGRWDEGGREITSFPE